MQSVADGDFEVQVKFDSAVTSRYQMQGILVEKDPLNYLRFDVHHDGAAPYIFAARIVGGVPTALYSAQAKSGGAPFWMRVQRVGQQYTQSWSTDGSTFHTAAQFNDSTGVTAIGPFAGNSGSGSSAPAFTSVIDSFTSQGTAAPPPESGGSSTPTFTRYVIDPAPPAAVLEKGLGDIDGDGRMDAIIGFSNPAGRGVYWYEFPHSGRAADPWIKHVITDQGVAYEDLAVADLNGDGAPDVVAAFNGPVYWFENPRGHGGNPATDRWQSHLIATGSGENVMHVADLDGDGKLDVATSSFIAFQNSADNWTTISPNTAHNGLAPFDIGSGHGAINLVVTGPYPHPTAWLENPIEHGGNARRDQWIAHTIGPTIGTPDKSEAAYATLDVNGDGRMDIVTANSEDVVASTYSGLFWWEAPADRRKGTWIPHAIDASYQVVHKLAVGDMNNDGRMDIIAAEQDQSARKRVAIFYSDGKGNFSPQVLGNGAGHNVTVGDVQSNGRLGILNAPHGFYGTPHAIELWLNTSPK